MSESSIDLGFFSPIVGVIASEEEMRMKRLVFRASRGKAYVQFYPMQRPLHSASGRKLHLLIYFVIYPQASEYLRSKLEKVCETFNTSHLNPLSIEIPSRREDILTALRESEQHVEGLLATLRLTEQNFQDYLNEI